MHPVVHPLDWAIVVLQYSHIHMHILCMYMYMYRPLMIVFKVLSCSSDCVVEGIRHLVK
jgi:hypothetical protein